MMLTLKLIANQGDICRPSGALGLVLPCLLYTYRPAGAKGANQPKMTALQGYQYAYVS